MPPHPTQSIKCDFDLSESPASPQTPKPLTDSDSAQPAVKEEEKLARSPAEYGLGDTFYAAPRPIIYNPVSPSAPSKRQLASLLVAYYLGNGEYGRRCRATRISGWPLSESSIPPYVAYII